MSYDASIEERKAFAFQAGEIVQRAGGRKSDCPYVLSGEEHLAAAWKDGWLQASHNHTGPRRLA